MYFAGVSFNLKNNRKWFIILFFLLLVHIKNASLVFHTCKVYNTAKLLVFYNIILLHYIPYWVKYISEQNRTYTLFRRVYNMTLTYGQYAFYRPYKNDTYWPILVYNIIYYLLDIHFLVPSLCESLYHWFWNACKIKRCADTLLTR